MRRKNLRVKVEKVGVLRVGGECIAPQIEVEMTDETSEVVVSLQYLENCFSKERVPHNDVKTSEGLIKLGCNEDDD